MGKRCSPIRLIDEVNEELSVGLRSVSHHVLDQVDPVGHKGVLVVDVVLRASCQALVVQHHIETLACKVPAACRSLSASLVLQICAQVD